MLQLKAIARPNLPALAWALTLERGAREAVLAHGNRVEVGRDFFVEGPWSGPFAERGFDSATTFSGSGGLLEGNDLLFCSATDTLQPLYFIESQGILVVSNSLLFALQECGAELDYRYRYHDVDIMSIVLGVRRATRWLPTTLSVPVELHYHCNVRVTTDLSITVLSKTPVPEFETFDEYLGLLQGEVTATVANAAAVERIVRFTPMATMSSGYDSPACAVLARRAGCKTALTFRTAAAQFGHQNDSGACIASILGLETVELDPCEYERAHSLPEAEFLAPGYGGDDVVFHGAERLLSERLLFTGYHGDRVWGRFGADCDDEIQRGDPSGGSFAEFRLRTCFFNVPVPFIGCTRLAAIRRISNSQSMASWSVRGTRYDRPIPRRVVEEAGVPRYLFGRTKKAIARPARAADIHDPALETVLSSATLADFFKWADSVPLFSSCRDKAVYLTLHSLHELIRHSVLLLNLVFPGTRGLGALDWYLRRCSPIPWKYAKPRNVHSLLIFWAHERLKDRYRDDSGQR